MNAADLTTKIRASIEAREILADALGNPNGNPAYEALLAQESRWEKDRGELDRARLAKAGLEY